MNISPQQQRFLDRRRQLLRTWRIVGPLTLVILIGLCVWLFLAFPLMFNPFEVVARLEGGSLESGTLQLMALFLPLTTLMLFVLLVVALLLVFAAMANDRKYLAIIDRCKADNGTAAASGRHDSSADD